MTTREFISNNFGAVRPRGRWNSSVYADEQGNIYSYGQHYPLLFKVGNLTIRNTRGYSNSTAKHILWAGVVDAVDVPLRGCNQYSWRNSENVDKIPYMLYNRRYSSEGITDKKMLKALAADLKAARREVAANMAAKKRKNTQVYKWLEYDFNKLTDALKTVEAAK